MECKSFLFKDTEITTRSGNANDISHPPWEAHKHDSRYTSRIVNGRQSLEEELKRSVCDQVKSCRRPAWQQPLANRAWQWRKFCCRNGQPLPLPHRRLLNLLESAIRYRDLCPAVNFVSTTRALNGLCIEMDRK